MALERNSENKIQLRKNTEGRGRGEVLKEKDAYGKKAKREEKQVGEKGRERGRE